MLKILVYAEVNRSQLYPIGPLLQELQKAGHHVTLRCSRSSLREMWEAGLEASAVSDYVEFAQLNDWRGSTYEQSLRALLDFLFERAALEVRDLSACCQYEKPDLLLVSATYLGGCAWAMSRHLPLMTWACDLLPFPASGIPPFGPGFPCSQGALGALKNWGRTNNAQKCFEQGLDPFNALLTRMRLAPVRDFQGWFSTLPALLYYTAEPFEYSRPWPQNVSLVGPNIWEPEDLPQLQLEDDSRPIVLVSLGSSYQENENLLRCAAQGLPSDSYQVVATTCSHAPQDFKEFPNLQIVRFASHNQILERAACLICSGGLNLVQKALYHAVPVCVVPQLRSQLEVGQRVVNSDVGQVVEFKKLSPSILSGAVSKAIGKKAKLAPLSQIFREMDSTQRALSIFTHFLSES